MPALVITINNEKRGAILEATPGKVVVIGRDEECDVSLPEATGLSRRHCSITCTESGFMLKDLGSTNGTFADNVRLEGEELLKEGVKYGIGSADFQVMGLSLLSFAANTESSTPAPQETNKAEEASAAKDSPPAKARTPKRKRSPKLKASGRAIHMAKTLRNKLNPLSNSVTTNSLSIIEILLVLIITFYAGLALYNALHGGSILPPFLD